MAMVGPAALKLLLSLLLWLNTTSFSCQGSAFSPFFLHRFIFAFMSLFSLSFPPHNIHMINNHTQTLPHAGTDTYIHTYIYYILYIIFFGLNFEGWRKEWNVFHFDENVEHFVVWYGLRITVIIIWLRPFTAVFMIFFKKKILSPHFLQKKLIWFDFDSP